jgi:D-3-phosphoglycerate dehydrogenase
MACRVWTDMEWVPEARDYARRQGWTVVSGSATGAEPMESVDAVVAGALVVGDAAFFARAPRLRVLARSGAGYDRIDLAAATAAGVAVVHTPEAPTTSTAEFALLLMLAVRRRLVAGVQRLSTGGWSGDPALAGEDLAGRTLGIVGLGRIGSRVAELARALQMEVQAFDPARSGWPVEVRRMEDLDTLCATSDIISLHAPSMPETYHLFDAVRLARCKPGAVLINTARGSLVDEAALAAALQSGALSGAGIDVWEPEPPAADHPLRGLPNVVATPHMAAMTRDGRRRSQLAALTQVAEVLGGRRPAHLLNPAVWTRRRGQEPPGAS